MAPLPKRKLSRGRARRRQEGQKASLKLGNTLTICPNCKKQIVAHRACSYCGYFRGKKYV